MPKRIGCAMRNGMSAARRVAIPHHYERGLQTKAGKPVEGTEAAPADVRDGYHRAVSAAREGPLSASTIALSWSPLIPMQFPVKARVELAPRALQKTGMDTKPSSCQRKNEVKRSLGGRVKLVSSINK
jgi:hypothetical protein